MGSIALERYRDVLNSTSYHPGWTIWTFDSMITAYGGDWTLGGPGGSGNSLVVTVAELGLVRYLSSGFYGDFWGFISDTPFSQVKLTGSTGDRQRMFFLDNMVYDPVQALPAQVSFLSARAPLAATPLPGAVWLVGGGLLAIVGFRRLVR